MMAKKSKKSTRKKRTQVTTIPKNRKKETVNIFLLLGIASFMGLIFMVIFFFNERLGITPWLSVIFLDNFTEGENWILFMISIIFAFFVGILTIYLIFRRNIKVN